MRESDIVKTRLLNQQLTNTELKTPADMVRRMGAVQSQDFAAAKWALGLRLPDATDEDIERAFNTGEILRTHVLRPTWHFVAPEDIRWMLALTAPRISKIVSSNYRKLELDDATLKKADDVIVKALKGGNQLTRPELMSNLEDAGISTEGLRSSHLMFHAELNATVCSGARKDKQFTYALLEERVPAANALTRDEALAELTKRYFTGHGAATLQDFVWWSGLTMPDAKAGIEAVKSDLIAEKIDDKEYYFPENHSDIIAQENAYLLPNYDEYTVAYKDRSHIYDQEKTSGGMDSRGEIIFNNVLLVDGRVVGIWKRTLKKNSVAIEIKLFDSLNESQEQGVMPASRRYAEFIGKTLEKSEIISQSTAV